MIDLFKKIRRAITITDETENQNEDKTDIYADFPPSGIDYGKEPPFEYEESDGELTTMCDTVIESDGEGDES
jgi:hypothetical protein